MEGNNVLCIDLCLHHISGVDLLIRLITKVSQVMNHRASRCSCKSSIGSLANCRVSEIPWLFKKKGCLMRNAVVVQSTVTFCDPRRMISFSGWTSVYLLTLCHINGSGCCCCSWSWFHCPQWCLRLTFMSCRGQMWMMMVFVSPNPQLQDIFIKDKLYNGTPWLPFCFQELVKSQIITRLWSQWHYVQHICAISSHCGMIGRMKASAGSAG